MTTDDHWIIEDDARDCNNENMNLYVVDDVTGVNPYVQYVDKWNQDVPGDLGGGDKAIEQHATETVNDRAADREATATATAMDAVGEFDFEVPISGNVITPQQTNTLGGVPQVGGRPTRVRKPVQRLVPSFKGKSYSTSMVQHSEQRLGMLAKESISNMESQLLEVGDDQDAAMMGIIMANFSMKQSVKMFGKAQTEEACKKEIKQIHAEYVCTKALA